MENSTKEKQQENNYKNSIEYIYSSEPISFCRYCGSQLLKRVDNYYSYIQCLHCGKRID